MSLDQLPNPSSSTSDYMMLRMLLQDTMKPLLERLDKLEAKLDDLDARYYRKDYLDQRLKPLEESALTKNQRLGVIISAVVGAVSVLVNLLTHLQLR